MAKWHEMCLECLELGVLPLLRQTNEEDEIRQFDTCVSSTHVLTHPASKPVSFTDFPKPCLAPEKGHGCYVREFQPCFGLSAHVITALGFFSCQEWALE